MVRVSCEFTCVVVGADRGGIKCQVTDGSARPLNCGVMRSRSEERRVGKECRWAWREGRVKDNGLLSSLRTFWPCLLADADPDPDPEPREHALLCAPVH